MTQYTQKDLDDDWEFKIVRANTAAFRKPAEFSKLIQEEALAGWVLLEKLDNQRVRFKRPRSARAGDNHLPPGVDPYRTHYGMSPTNYTLLVLAVTIVGVVGVMLTVAVCMGSAIRFSF